MTDDEVEQSVRHPSIPGDIKATATIAEELDNLLDISIEIASNKRMKQECMKSFKLTFKDRSLEKKASSLAVPPH